MADLIMPTAHDTEPHPYLHEPVLYISGLPSYVTDDEIALVFQPCAKFRLKITREEPNLELCGTIEFQHLDRAEKALACLHSKSFPGLNPPANIVLSPYPPTDPPTPLPPASATPRLVKFLPTYYTDFQLYDLFRPYGALAAVKTRVPFAQETAMIEFWREDDARKAEDAMYCAQIDGHNIAIQSYQPRRTSGSMSDFGLGASPFVASGYPYPVNQYSPPRASFHSVRPGFVHGPGQQVQLAPLSGPGSNSHSGLIDPCNLFIKNLDTSITSNELFTHFRPYGHIVSARVMRNEAGESRGFGFVSFQTPDQASAAMHAMNGIVLEKKTIIVRLHEPKQLRQEKLAARFSGHNGHPRSASGATSPTLSEGGDSYVGWPSPSSHPAVLGSPTPTFVDRTPERQRRGSGSYYQAALSGSLNVPLQYDSLSALSPVVRKEVLSGELTRRIKSMGAVRNDEVEPIVESIVSLSLSDVVSVIQDPAKLADRVRTTKSLSSPSPAPSQDSRLLDPITSAAIASAPEHPSTPVSIPGSLATPPRTSSPSGSLHPTSERERMVQAISRLEKSQIAELADLLMSLPKRERALCLFNTEVLRAKIADAKIVLEAGEEEEPAPAPAPIPVTPQKKVTIAEVGTPETPDLSSRGPSVAASPAPQTPGTSVSSHSFDALAQMPFTKIYNLINSGANLPSLSVSPELIEETNQWVASVSVHSLPTFKEQAGRKWLASLKANGVKKGIKVVSHYMTQIDEEETRALAHVSCLYPIVAKHKALKIGAENKIPIA